MANGDQWFAIFAADTKNLISVGNVVAFPLNAGQRAITVDGPQNGRYWDASKLDWSANPPQPPPPPPPPAKPPFPYAEEWFPAKLVFANRIQADATITFPPGLFTVPPLIDAIQANIPGVPPPTSYIQFTSGFLTKDGVRVWAKAGVALNYTIPIVVHAVQRYKDGA